MNEQFISFCELFKQQVKSTPAAIAVRYDHHSLSYEELDYQAKQLASCLKANGVKSENIVALSIDNGLDLIVGILGILRSGAAYMPIDPNYPEERIKKMMEDAKPTLLLTEESLEDKFSFVPNKIVPINKLLPNENLYQEEIIQPNQLAYVMFTSGSTGNPKGILLEHRALSYAAKTHKQLHSDRLISLMFSSISFDASLLVITHTLISGGTVCIPKHETSIDPDKMIHFIHQRGINYTLCVPSFYSMLLGKSRELPSLARIDLGGENMTQAIPDSHAKAAPQAILNNVYGPSEYAVGATFAKIYDPETKRIDKITIGKPFPGTQVYVLDENLQETPNGVNGEIFIGGPGLARGYLDNEALSSEKFIWVTLPGRSPIRLYRTGDFGRFLPDGNLEFLGRMDYQIKIRGYRVELGEIEHAICQHPKINEAVVVLREDTYQNKHLVAYFTSGDNKDIGHELKAYLTQMLPKYMIPYAFVQLESFSRTPNGKIDRNALPPIKEKMSIEEPLSTLGQKLYDIWKKVLHLEVIHKDENFFDLGGDSLTLAVLQTQIEIDLGIKIPILDLLKYPTIAQLSQHLERQTNSKIVAIHHDLSTKKKMAFERFRMKARR